MAEATQLPAEKKLTPEEKLALEVKKEKREKLTAEEKKLLSRKDLTVQERELLLSRDLTKEELEILNAPPSSLTPRNKDRRLRMIFPDAHWDDPEFDPLTLPPTYDYQFINKDGIEVCMPGTNEFTAQRLLNKFMSSSEIVAVESSDGPLTGDPSAPEGEATIASKTTATVRSPGTQKFGTEPSITGKREGSTLAG